MDALTPEELETLLEDAYLLGDGPAVAGLFEPSAVLVSGGVVSCAEALIARGSHRAGERVVQAGDVALVVGSASTAVARRGPDRSWRYVIVDLS